MDSTERMQWKWKADNALNARPDLVIAFLDELN